MSQAPPTRRRWFQFSLGTMLWIVLVLALATAWWNEFTLRLRAESRAATADQGAIRIARQLLDERAEWAAAMTNAVPTSQAPVPNSSSAAGK